MRRKQYIAWVFLVSVVLFWAKPVWAEYVLPYPAYMPGSKFYRISRILDTLKNYWYWGDIAQIKYHLGLSDKYLVEAKTLFEYKQYLLAIDALSRSSSHVTYVLPLLKNGTQDGKDTRLFVQMIKNAMVTHQEVLIMLRRDLPENFFWTPEKVTPSVLSLHKNLDDAIRLRVEVLSKL